MGSEKVPYLLAGSDEVIGRVTDSEEMAKVPTF